MPRAPARLRPSCVAAASVVPGTGILEGVHLLTICLSVRTCLHGAPPLIRSLSSSPPLPSIPSVPAPSLPQPTPTHLFPPPRTVSRLSSGQVGQAYIIACAVLIHNLNQVGFSVTPSVTPSSSFASIALSTPPPRLTALYTTHHPPSHPSPLALALLILPCSAILLFYSALYPCLRRSSRLSQEMLISSRSSSSFLLSLPPWLFSNTTGPARERSRHSLLCFIYAFTPAASRVSHFHSRYSLLATFFHPRQLRSSRSSAAIDTQDAFHLAYRYPSKVFVGDTYCYFAGMTFAVVGVSWHENCCG